MIIRVEYNKAENTLEVTNDIPECSVVVNNNATIDTNDNLIFELSVDTSYLAEIQSELDGEPNE